MGPQAIGVANNDLAQVAAYVNRAQQNLINAGGETGWWGGWQKVVFTVSKCAPYISLPRQFARVINLAVCKYPVRVNNEFYEMLEASVGLQDFVQKPNWHGAVAGFDRGTFPTMLDVSPANQYLQVMLTDPRDAQYRMLISPAQDQNGQYIYTQDGAQSVNGFYMPLLSPSYTTPFIVTSIGGVAKDATYGDVLLYQVDATTGAQVLLARYGPDEVRPSYRRYYLNKLPWSCCDVQVLSNPCTAPPGPPPTVQITAMAKLEFIPANRLTDWIVIGNIPALIEECKSIRYADMDSEKAPAMEEKCHKRAIQLLNQELVHYLGKEMPAINLAPWGTARLEKVMAAVRNG